ncbi:acyltransferase family protein [Curtobacterium oceanosedimentum]|uniref:acyltransferase family protein n=1 Tax=Curtobacterium oceanosedimentum TaxID=465820 RepID=UPI001CE0FA6A|nr:acyltransferase family protein [Curtobacterium oceanosedimentum]MCA5922334.1 acyltransferase [Curtobacterium oceanosedimentum]
MIRSTVGRQHRLDVQGLRAVAVLGVVLFHAGMPGAQGGFVGVDVFFVISGYLITGNLLRDRAVHGRLRLIVFFRHRLARLAPAALVTVAATVLAVHVLLPPLDRVAARVDALAALVGAENLRLAHAGTDYLADHTTGPFQQFWSLGVEEQFYVAWALLLAGVLAVPALRRHAFALTAVLCALSIGAVLIGSTLSGPWTFFGVHTRAWEFGVGALAAIAARSGRRRVLRSGRLARRATAPVGLGLIMTASVLFDASTPFPGPLTVVPVAGALLVVLPGDDDDPVRRALAWGPMRWVGDRSYSMYLWHWPALVVPALALDRPLGPAETIAALAVTVVLTWSGHALVETRMSNWARRGGIRSFVVVAGVVATAVLVASATALPPLRSTVAAPSATPAAVLRGPWAPRTVPANLAPGIAEAAADLPPVYRDGCHGDYAALSTKACRYGAGQRDVVLFGDSHAAQWTSPLATVAGRHDAALVTMTKSSCPSADLAVRRQQLGRSYPECDVWRRDAFRQLERMRPELVVLADAANGYRSDADAAGWRDAVARTIERIRATGAEVVVIGDTPVWEQTPNRCLSASLEDVAACTGQVRDLTDTSRSAAQAAAASAAGVPIVDPVPWICQDHCSPVLWDVLVYRDTNHLTDTMARALTPRTDAALGPVLDRVDDR